MRHTSSFLVAPPIGGALYSRFGFRAPFIFGMIVAAIDFVGRMLFIERKDAAAWDVADDVVPASLPSTPTEKAQGKQTTFGFPVASLILL